MEMVKEPSVPVSVPLLCVPTSITLAPTTGSSLVSRTTPFTCTVAFAWLIASLALTETTGADAPNSNIPAQKAERNFE